MSSAGRPAVLDRPAGETAGAARRPGQDAGGPLWKRAVPPAATLALMLWRITTPSYWRDEGATLEAVRRPFGALIRMLGHTDAVHGAYYMIIWVVVRLGGSGEFSTRLPSALAMAVAAAGVAGIGRRLVSPRAGLFAGLVFAALPEISWYGQDARSFAMVTALATTASYLLVRVLGAGGSRRGWLSAYGLALTCLGLVNIFGLTLIPAHGLTVALSLRRARGRHPDGSGPDGSRLGGSGPGGSGPDGSDAGASHPDGSRAARTLAAGWLAAACVAAAVASPLFVLAWQQRAAEKWLKTPGRGTLADLRDLVGPSALVSVILLIIGCGILLSAVGRRGRIRAGWPAALPALCLPWLLLPPAVLLAGSLIQPVYTLRYVLFIVPAVALLAGPALAVLGRVAGTIALALVLLIAVPAQLAARRPGAHGDNIRMADAIVAAARRPGDAVLYASTGARNMAAAYPDGLAALRNIALDRAPIPSGTLAGTYLPAPAVRRRLAAVRRVWVVEVSREAGPQRLPLLQGLRFRIVRKWHVSDIWLMLYRHRHRHRHRHPHSHHHPYQRQPRQLSRPPPLPGRPRRAGGFGAGRYWQSIARRLPARVNRSPLEH
jgi:mannosyltransferase